MNPFDIIIIAAIALSGVFAFVRGFVKEALSVGAWIGAGLAALYAFPYARPIAERLLPKGMMADIAAGFVVFILVLIVLSILTSAVSRRVKESSLSALDRTLGLIFGLVRGVVVVCLAFIVLNWALPPASQPKWIEEARTKRLLATGADALRALVPPTLRERANAAASEAQQRARERVEQAREAEGALRALQAPRPVAGGQPAESHGDRGYGPEERRDLNRLFQQNAD